jgi:hypothetical protein
MIFDTRSHQQNGDDPSTIRAPIRLHRSPDTRPSRPLNSTNTSGNVWYEAAREYGLHRCLPAHILLVRLCHHRPDCSGSSEVTNATKHHRKIATTIRLVSVSVKGPRTSVIEPNSIIFGQFILGETTINLGWQKISQNVVFGSHNGATN